MTHAIRSVQPFMRASTAGLLLTAALMAVGCAGKPVEIGTLYQRLGAEAGVAALVDELMSNIERDSRLEGVFAKTDASAFKQTLAAQVCQIGDGTCSDQTASVQTALAGMKLTNEQFDAFIGDFAKALDQHEVGPNVQRELLFPLKALRGDVIDTGTSG